MKFCNFFLIIFLYDQRVGSCLLLLDQIKFGKENSIVLSESASRNKIKIKINRGKGSCWTAGISMHYASEREV